MKKTIVYLLISVLLTSVFSGCENSGTAAVTTSAESAPEAETGFIDTLPSGAYDGTAFHIGWGTPFDKNECTFTLEEAGGDIINEAVYERNRKTEDKLGITVASDRLGAWTELLTLIQTLVLSGDNPHDVFCASAWFMFQSSINGLLSDLNQIPSIDFSRSWWDGDTIAMYSLGSDTLYFASGAINYFDDYSASAVYFNKVLCDGNNLAYPYDAVKSGDWTYEMFYGYISGFASDLNGDGKFDENDRYGFMENAGGMTRMYNAFGESVLVVGEDGGITVNDSERIFEITARVLEQLFGTGNDSTVIAERRLGYEKANALFPDGKVLFMTGGVGDITDYRQLMTDDFGVLPFPKYDGEQEEYYCQYNTAWGTAYAVPVTNTEPERTGNILEVMGYYSPDTINTAVIEKSVLTKSTRDDESAEMLQIVFDSKFYELGQWGASVYDMACTQVVNGKNTYASALEKVRAKTEAEFAAVKDYYIFG